MRPLLHKTFTMFLLGTFLLSLALGGCQPVRENRQINFSSDGNSVGFQHGQEGIFVADKEGGNLIKVFQPGPEVIASSTPLWSPADRRLIFTTARDPSQGNQTAGLAILNPEDPAGGLHFQRPIKYTCYLREEAKENQEAKVTPLFEGACDHVGYVAANLAVRWHPDGHRILYLHQTGEHRHSLFEYDVRTKASRLVFPQAAEAMIFDWTPNHSHLVCVLGSKDGKQGNEGIWIGRLDEVDWWRVPESSALAEGELHSLLEQLRATQPAWTPDGSRFAFASTKPGSAPGQASRHYLRLGTLASHEVEALAEGSKPYWDLRWSPDGMQLGVVVGRADGSLHLWRKETGLSTPINAKTVRHFAGWDATGKHLAYVVPDDIPHTQADTWAFLLPPDKLARDAVYVADGQGTEAGKAVFSGMRVTFPHWSPREEKLSVWFTFSPTHRSWFSRLLGWGLRPGDPAAMFDVKTGAIGWMAVNPHEKAQVGHYYLLKRDYSTALKWYDEAQKDLPPAGKPDLNQFFQNLVNPRDFSFFQYYCLTKLNRPDDAAAKLAQFKQNFFKPPEELKGVSAGTERNPQMLEELLDPKGLCVSSLRDLYIAEVFLSLDAADDGCAFFRAVIATRENDEARLSSGIALAQLLLLEKKHQAYAELATHTIMPLLLKVWQPQAPRQAQGLDSSSLLVLVGGLSLAPIYSPEFLRDLPTEKVAALVPRWNELRSKARDDAGHLAIDLFLQAAYQRLGSEQELKEVTARLDKNPAKAELLPEGGIPAVVQSARAAAVRFGE